MTKRYLEIIRSPRFHQAFAVFLVQIAQHYGFIDSFVANAISVLLGVSITIATVDRTADSISDK
jgi:hypothetical protein